MNKKEIAHSIKELVYEMYQAGVKDGKEESITKEKAIDFLEAIGWQDAHDEEMMEHGMEMVWECFKKLVCPIENGGLSTDDLKKIFGTLLLSRIARDYSPSEAIQKIKDYEERKKQKDAEIRVGDEVYAFEHCDLKRIVIYINDNGDVADTLLPSGMIMACLTKDLTKTGKHYDAMEEMLKELRRDEDNADSN